jgi:hypothetical protein
MRALQFMLIILTALVFDGLAPFSPPARAAADAGELSPVASRPNPTMAPVVADAGSPDTPAAKAADVEKEAIGEAERSPVGVLLIVLAVVLFVVIVGFIIRHHRTGRAG